MIKIEANYYGFDFCYCCGMDTEPSDIKELTIVSDKLRSIKSSVYLCNNCRKQLYLKLKEDLR